MRLTGGFGIIPSTDVSQFLKGPTLVAMATKFETKLAVTQLVLKSPRGLHLVGGFRVRAVE